MSDIKININRTEGNNKQKKNRFFSDTIFLWGGAMLSCFLWGSAFPVIKIGYREFSISSDNMAAQILFAGIRFLLAGIAVVITGSIMERRIMLPQKSSASKIFKLSFFQTVAQYTFFYIGLSHTSGVRASIVQGTNVFVALFVAGLIYKLEKLDPKKMIGCAIGFSGVVLVNLSGTDLGKGSFLTGDLPIILSTVAYAFSSVLLKKYTKDESPAVLSGYQFIVGGALLILGGLLAGGRIEHISPAGIGSLLYLVFVSAAAYSIWGVLMKHNPVSRVAVFGFMTPVFGVITSLLFLDEAAAFGLIHLISLMLVCLGILTVNSGRTDK